MTEYRHSPKVILITGPRAGGKTTVAKQLVKEMGYHHVWLDGINGRAGKTLGLGVPDMYHYSPEKAAAIEKELLTEIKSIRYTNLVIEGDALRIRHILNTAINMSLNYYGDYTVFKAFSLTPSDEQRHKQYMLREIQRVKDYVKTNSGKPREKHTGDKRCAISTSTPCPIRRASKWWIPRKPSCSGHGRTKTPGIPVCPWNTPT